MSHNGTTGSCLSDPNYGRQTLFFLWNAMVLVLESVLGRTRLFQLLKKTLPSPLKTILVLLSVLPISHWFTHEYVGCGAYTDVMIGVPLIVAV